MMNIIRKHASSWMKTLIFVAIIVVFAFYFGFNRIANRYSGKNGVVATVDGTPITNPYFQYAYENNYKTYEQILKGKDGNEITPDVEKSIKLTTVRQLIQQEVLNKFASKVDITPSKLELAELVVSLPIARGEDGRFDRFNYEKRVLPWYSQRYGIDYEKLLENELTLNHIQNLFYSANKAPSAKFIYDAEKTKWNFQVTEFASEADAKNGRNGKPKNTGPITINERTKIFGITPEDNAWQKIFALSSETPSLTEPVRAGDKWYTVRLLKKEVPTDEDWAKEKDEFTARMASLEGRQFFSTWLDSLMKNSKIKTNVNIE